MSLFYSVLNPIVKTILKSPAHSIFSNNTLVLRYTGRKSGKHYELPISYAKNDARLLGFTAKKNLWWRNLQGGVAVEILLAGKRLAVQANVETSDQQVLAADFITFLRQVPRDAKISGVRLADNGTPNMEDVQVAVQNLVAVNLTPLTPLTPQ